MWIPRPDRVHIAGITVNWQGSIDRDRTVASSEVREVGRDTPLPTPMRQNRAMPDTPLQPVDNSIPSQAGATMPSAEDSDGGTSYGCPRCGVEVVSPFYGPCDSCRGVLRATITADAEHMSAADYEPKMNVTPNAVATKE
jgi:hypothetical protein